MKKRTYRQIFGNFRSSANGKYTKEVLYRAQRGFCCSCMQPYEMRSLEMHHLVPVKELELAGNLSALTDIRNLVLLCRSCNAKQSCKVDTRFTD